MSWRGLLQQKDEVISAPWTGGRILRKGGRTWEVDGRLPREFGWYSFGLNARKAALKDKCDPNPEVLSHTVSGYLVGDRLVADGVRIDPDPTKILECSEQVFLLDPGLERFVRISAGRTHEGGPLIFKSEEFPLGPEESVRSAFFEKKPNLDQIKEISPALDAAFRMESFQRTEAERRRAEEEKRRQEEEHRQQIAKAIGTAEGRRELAKLDFAAAAKAALRITGAEYLDHRQSRRQSEVVVQFRFRNRRFECVCDLRSLAIIDAGICLTDHRSGEKGDTRFSLESLPAVIGEAMDRHVLHVFRHVDDDFEDEDEY